MQAEHVRSLRRRTANPRRRPTRDPRKREPRRRLRGRSEGERREDGGDVLSEFADGPGDAPESSIAGAEVDGEDLRHGTRETKGSVEEIEVVELQATAEQLVPGEVLAAAERGDKGKAVVGMERVCVGERRPGASGEAVQHGNSMPCGQPPFDGESKGKGRVVPVRRNNEEVHSQFEMRSAG